MILVKQTIWRAQTFPLLDIGALDLEIWNWAFQNWGVRIPKWKQQQANLGPRPHSRVQSPGSQINQSTGVYLLFTVPKTTFF
ncbi:hypothetical protein WICMUC_002250 [Wickerhamomyces mucosus]|uniref:Uncharacterized protein n=1 Tax=Wickerhamomyces mucosus TaxID=1378264 RepID=A0A9P8PR27_9ASCO|nr:hypothetical protein WICMUC_002250 [Wickerhamomyces mucosus]